LHTFAPAFEAKELIEGLKEIGFRLKVEGKDYEGKAGKIISDFLVRR